MSIAVYATSVRYTNCRSCQAHIAFAQVVESDRWMPFDMPLAIEGRRSLGDVKSGTSLERWHVPVLLLDQEKSHFATCPDAAKFSRRSHAARRSSHRPSARARG